jgi:hypothetical protein
MSLWVVVAHRTGQGIGSAQFIRIFTGDLKPIMAARFHTAILAGACYELVSAR